MAATIGKHFCRMFQGFHGTRHLPSCHPAISQGQINTVLKDVYRSAWYRSFFRSDQTSSDKIVEDPKPAIPKETDPKPAIPKETGPTKPRRPPNVFVMYIQTIQNDLKKANPGMTRMEIIHEAAKRWLDLDPEEKSKIMLERKDLYEKYKTDHTSYIENMTPEQIREEEKEKARVTMKKLKKARRHLGMPQRPWNSYQWFLSEKFTEHFGDVNESSRERKDVMAFFSQVKDKWNRSSETEKEAYYNKQRESQERYHSEMADWEESMIESGRFDVLRSSTIKKLKQAEGKKKESKKKNKVIDQN